MTLRCALTILAGTVLCGIIHLSCFGTLAFSTPGIIPKNRMIAPHHQRSRILIDVASSCISKRNGKRSRGFVFRSTRDRASDVTYTTSTEASAKQFRQIARVEQFARLPIWPIWSGVLLFITSRLSPSLAAAIEDTIGGRVCPNFFNAQETSPFVLMVHHRHSFSALDPIRFIQRTFFPEGFPSHPHRGFVTVTYCLKGGMVHRDSLGIKQSYGAEPHHDGAHVQWLTAGAGVQHEEMWDTTGNWFWSDQELYQIWLNLPSSHKMVNPRVELLRRHDIVNDDPVPEGRTPVIEENGVITTVVSGEYNQKRATIDCPTDAAILRVHFTKRATWRHRMPRQHETAILYVRKGSIRVGSELIPVHHTAYLTSEGEELVIESDEEADVLLLSGEPLREP